MSRRGFSLLEVLAATVLVGLVAAALLPVLRRLGETNHLHDDRLRATALLDAYLRSPTGIEPPALPDGWHLEQQPLRSRDPAPVVLGHAWPTTGRQCWRIRDARGGVLAWRLTGNPGRGR